MSETEPTRCVVYRSPKREFLYLYLPEGDDFSAVPEPLLQSFGTPEKVMTLELSRDRPLARAAVGEVIAKLEDPGFYLQMPPKDTNEIP